MSNSNNNGGISGLDCVTVFNGDGFKEWLCALSLVFMINSPGKVMDDANKPVPANPNAVMPKESAAKRKWKCMEQKVIALISLCVSPAIRNLLDTQFKVSKTDPNGLVTTTLNSISAVHLKSASTTAGVTTVFKATAALIIAYLCAQYGQVLLMDTFLVFKRVWSVKIPLSGNPAAAMNQIDAYINKLATENIIVPDFIHAMIIINVLPAQYNKANFLALITLYTNLKPTAVCAAIQALYVNSPALMSCNCRNGGDYHNNNITAKISAIPCKPTSGPQFCLQHAPGAPYALGSGSGNHPNYHNSNNGQGHGNGCGGQGGCGRGGTKRQDKGKGREHNAHAAANLHFAAHTIKVPLLLDRISDAPADKLSSADYNLLKAKVAAGRTCFGVGPGSADEFNLRRMAHLHIVERCLALTAEPTRNTLFAAESPVSAAIPSVLVPEFCVQHVLTWRQQKERKLAQMVSTDHLGAPSSITGTYCDHWAADNVDDACAALAAQINELYRLNYKANSSNKDLLSKEVLEDWLNNPEPGLRTTASGACLLSRFVLPPAQGMSCLEAL
jgi:hypothetical protein